MHLLRLEMVTIELLASGGTLVASRCDSFVSSDPTQH